MTANASVYVWTVVLSRRLRPPPPARAHGTEAALRDALMFPPLVHSRRVRVWGEMLLGDGRPARNIGAQLERMNMKMTLRARPFILVQPLASSLAASTSLGEVDRFPPGPSGSPANFL